MEFFNDLITAFNRKYPQAPEDFPTSNASWLIRMDDAIRDNSLDSLDLHGFTVMIPGYPEYLENTPVVMNIVDHRNNTCRNYVFIGTSFCDGAVEYNPIPLSLDQYI